VAIDFAGIVAENQSMLFNLALRFLWQSANSAIPKADNKSR
jgi:hypothetical protein